jgi:adenylosuccinate synthase
MGHEFGSTTGRPRRCGWLDLVALKYAIMIDGVTELIMMKADVLDNFETIKVCTKYRIKGELTDEFPSELNGNVEPVYEELKGWNHNLSAINNKEEFPLELWNYMRFIEEKLGVPIKIVSVGPNRSQTIRLK